MGIYRASLLAASLLTLTACDRPDASGIYLHASDRLVQLIQLVQTKDGKVSGRLEEVAAGANGNVTDTTTALDGSVSKHDLMLKPASAWYGGLSATGSFSENDVTLTGSGFSLTAQKSSLENYQSAVAHLKSLAAGERARIAAVQAAQAAQAQATRQAQAQQAAQAQAIQDAANKTTAVENATAQLRAYTAKISAGVANSPDFSGRSAANTSRIDRMLQMAPTLSDYDRNRLVVAADQVENGTNQIDLACSNYVLALNQIVQTAGPIAQTLQGFCGSPQGASFAQPCGPAKAAAAEYQATVTRGHTIFLGYKQAVQEALSRQASMIRRMGG